MYERRSQPPISRRAFVGRLAAHFGFVLALIAASLGVGVAGYMAFEGLAPVDAFLHASALLGGMGLAGAPVTMPGKLFAGLYALYAGLVFIASFSVLLAPILHRLLHRFHWQDDPSDSR